MFGMIPVSSQVLIVAVLMLAPAFAGAAAPVDEGAVLKATIVRISGSYGNLDTDAMDSELAELGIGTGDRFAFEYRGKRYPVLLGTSYSDVAEGDWVALFTDAGALRLAISFGNASEALGCEEGDAILIRKDE